MQRKEEIRQLTTWAKCIAMDLVYPILDGNLLGEQHYRPFRSTIGTGARLQTYQSQHRGGVDDPSSMARGMLVLSKKLRDGIFAAKEDRTSIDVPKMTP